jgi:ferredoxin
VKIAVDADRCEGHGLCAERAPAVFDLDDDGVVAYRFHDADVPTEHLARARDAASVCPVAALRLL